MTTKVPDAAIEAAARELPGIRHETMRRVLAAALPHLPLIPASEVEKLADEWESWTGANSPRTLQLRALVAQHQPQEKS